MIAAIPGAGEIGLLCIGGFALFRRWGNTFAEAAAYAAITTMMALSCLFQLAFLLGDPTLSIGPELVLCALAVAAAWRLHQHIRQAFKTIRNFVLGNPVAAGALCLGWCFLAMRALFLRSGIGPWDNLEHLLFFQQHGASFSTAFTGPFIGEGQALFPINCTILGHLFSRFHTGSGVGLLGFLAYLSIGFSTYALARRYSWPPTAFTVTMVVMSMPRLVYLAVSPGEEIIPAAVAVFCILAIIRVVEQPNIRDLIFLILGILFGISGKAMCFVFPVILVFLSCVLLFRRHGVITWWTLITSHRWAAVSALGPAVIFSQCWLFLYNALHYGTWIGSSTCFPRNTDGLQGSLANFVRYLLESVHLTRPVDLVCQWMMGFSLTGMLNGIYDLFIMPIFGNRGAAVPFEISWMSAEIFWFGPFGFLLVMPAVFYALVRGHRRIKAIAIALIGYLYIITLIFAWMPGNARFFTIFYACGGFCIAFLLPPWRFTRMGKQVFQMVSVLLLFYACLSI